jgi:hypothetical protein
MSKAAQNGRKTLREQVDGAVALANVELGRGGAGRGPSRSGSEPVNPGGIQTDSAVHSNGKVPKVSTNQGRRNLMHPITDEWYGKADNYSPQPGKDYAWVLEYAKFRFEWACEKGRYIQEKAVTLFKLLLSLAAGVGAVFSFLISRGATFKLWGVGCAALGIASLVGAVAVLLLVFDPADHLYPIKEVAALEYIDRGALDQDARANLSLTLTASTEFERQATNRSARCLRVGIALAWSALFFFMFSLFLGVRP